MDPIVQGLLSSNLVTVEYLSIGGFPTRGLMTKNLHFMYHEDSIEFDGGDFFQAYDILRKKKTTVLNEEEIFKITVYNPGKIDPLDLCKGACQPTHDCRSEAIAEFKKQNGDFIPIGDPLLLADPQKRILIDFFTGMNLAHLTEEELDTCLEDLSYMSQDARFVDDVTYSVYFGCDMDFKSEEEGLRYAAQRWFDLINVYRDLYLQELEEDSPVGRAVKDLQLPNIESFGDYEQVIGFWPYLLSPRPSEIGQ